MSDVPRRKWLQVHLSTAVVLMFAAGGIIWANVRERAAASIVFDDGVNDPYLITRSYGWPCDAFGYEIPNRLVLPTSRLGALVNVVVALAILFATWFVCERWIAWRACRRKG